MAGHGERDALILGAQAPRGPLHRLRRLWLLAAAVVAGRSLVRGEAGRVAGGDRGAGGRARRQSAVAPAPGAGRSVT